MGRKVVLAILAVAALAFALAATALAAHVETSPAASGLYVGSNPSGFVAFTFEEDEIGCIPCGKSRTVITVSDLRFHDACTKSLTRIHKAIRVRRNRFSYATDAVSISGKTSYRRDVTLPTVSGTVREADPDCDADGSITFDLKPPS